MGFDALYDNEPREHYDPNTSTAKPIAEDPRLADFCLSHGPMDEMEQTIFRRDLLELIRQVTGGITHV